MSCKIDSAETYPSAEGSNVHRSSGFWSLPTLISSPACSLQSMVTNISSQPDNSSYDILFQYPSQTLQYQILDEFSKWFAEASLTFPITLYTKLLAVEEVWRKMEEMAAQLAESKVEAQPANACMHAAFEHVTAVMEAQRLLLDMVEYPNAGDRVRWTLFMDGEQVFQGVAESRSEVLCAAFFGEMARIAAQYMPPYYYYHC